MSNSEEVKELVGMKGERDVWSAGGSMGGKGARYRGGWREHGGSEGAGYLLEKGSREAGNKCFQEGRGVNSGGSVLCCAVACAQPNSIQDRLVKYHFCVVLA